MEYTRTVVLLCLYKLKLIIQIYIYLANMLKREKEISIDLEKSILTDRKNSEPMYWATIILGYPMPSIILDKIEEVQKIISNVLSEKFVSHLLDKIHLTVISIIRSQKDIGWFNELWNNLNKEDLLLDKISQICSNIEIFKFKFKEVFLSEDWNIVLKVENIDDNLNNLRLNFSNIFHSKYIPNKYWFIVIGKIITIKQLDSNLLSLLKSKFKEIKIANEEIFSLSSISIVKYSQRNLLNWEILRKINIG
ncbi:MAG: hypothetical protein ACD_4C00308G0006 [uncultured bacterium (gcode 4)]|uniref:Uncharacterized protein n=1 Tax=uncultured bacterium (gcode 4) TaxID=1234023 RepID=K2FTX1_9BACT|nr:MAG: hypothetical protein ACD_4C00308G0006 [uncultured bacterium (gcode 4)]